MALRTFLSGGNIDRQSWQRVDARLIEQKRASAEARFVLMTQAGFLIEAQSALLLERSDIEALTALDSAIYLGSDGSHELFVVDLPDETCIPEQVLARIMHFRSILDGLAPDAAALLAYAKGMIEWRRRHKYCGLCGSAMQGASGGAVLECSSAGCHERCFPRLDPAIIVLTVHDEKCLLGRQASWPEGRFSTLAGFVEPGESLEDAVHREVFEETSVRTQEICYLGSQPWPFPSSLMIGFHAKAKTTAIKLIDGELAEARWFSRADLERREVRLPPPASIAFRLIETWFDRDTPGRLQSLNLSSDFSARPD